MPQIFNAIQLIVALGIGMACEATRARANDVANLPSIESIGAGSDIGAFLAADVPAELTLAALRRAWSADPTIRDFLGLAENSWDFDAPGGVPGFGSITREDVRLEFFAGISCK
jgi:hypothetical protein